MKKTVKKNARSFAILATAMMLLAFFGIFSMVASAAVPDLSVTVDAQTVTLKDTDEDGFYEIADANELYAFAIAVNTGNTDINGRLTANITVNNGVINEDGTLKEGSDFTVWTPIGTQLKPFTGSFDGNGKTVSGLYVDNQNVSYVGLFGNVASNAENDNIIENVSVVDSYFSGNRNIGGVVGSNGATVKDCYNKASVISKNEYAGGIVGYNAGTVIDCSNDGAIEGNNYVGGIAGSNNSTVTKVYNTGKIHGENAVGGVAGFNAGSVTVCYNTGTISGSVSNIGGVVGENAIMGTIESCYNVGNVFGYPPTVSIDAIGGVVGLNDGTVDTCYYLNTCAAKGEGTAKSEGAFKSGEVTYLLNGSVSEGELNWYQLITILGEEDELVVKGDALPNFNKTDYVVYYHPREVGSQFEYSNHKHEWVFEMTTQDKSGFEGNAHQYTNNQLTAYCQNNEHGECHWNGGNGGTLTLHENGGYNYKIYNGLPAVVSYEYENWYFTVDSNMVVRYYACEAMKDPSNPSVHDHTTALETAPVNAGYYCIEITYTYDSVEYVLQNYYEIIRQTIYPSHTNSFGDITYDGQNHIPYVNIMIYGTTLVKDRDYTVKFYRGEEEIIEYEKGFTETGVITVVIEGIGNYMGTVTKTYEIKKPNIEKENFSFYINVNGLDFSYRYSNRYYSDKYGYIYQDPWLAAVYNGQTQEPTVLTVSGLFDGSWLYPVKGTDYTVKFCRINADGVMEETTDFTNAGEIYAVIEAMGNYEGKVTLVYDIDPVWIESEHVDISFGDLTFNGTDKNIELLYNGKDQIPEIVVTVDGKVLTQGIDYLYVFRRESVNTTNLKGLGTITLVVQGIGNYQGMLYIDYTIDKAEIFEENVTISPDVIYNTLDQKPEVSVTVGTLTLVQGTDYTVTFKRGTEVTTDFTNAGTITITVEGIGNYTGTVSKDYVIERKTIIDDDVTISPDVIYNAVAQKSDVVVTVGSLTLVVDKEYTVTFKRGTEVTTDFVNEGTITVVVEGIGNYQGTVSKDYVIERKTIIEDDVTISPDVIYNTLDQKPEVSVTIGTLTLVQGTDYTVTFKRGTEVTTDFTNAGTITITVEGIGNYTGTVIVDYVIERKAIVEGDVAVSGDMIYDAQEHKPVITVTVNGLTLVQDRDYTVTFKRGTEVTTDFTNAGTITVIVEGVGNYVETVEKTYVIERAQIVDNDRFDDDVYVDGFTTYNGSVQMPTVMVTLRGLTLVQGTDYTVTYMRGTEVTTDFTNVGTITVVIEGIGNYVGTVSQDYVIGRKVIVEDDVYVSPDVIYNTLSQKPEVSVTVNGLTLVQDRDYTVTFKRGTGVTTDFTNAGTITITVEGIGNYAGTVEETYVIEKASLTLGLTSPVTIVCPGNKILLEVYSNSSELPAPIFNNVMFNGESVSADHKFLKITVSDDFVFDSRDEYLITIIVTYDETDNYYGNSREITLEVRACGDCDEAIANLNQTVADLDAAMKNGDSALTTALTNLKNALENAQKTLEDADDANKDDLVKMIETAENTLKTAIEKIQKDLDDATAKLEAADATNASNLANAIDTLNKAIDAAEAAALAGDTALEGKLNDAQVALEGKLAEVQKNLDDATAKLEAADATNASNLTSAIETLNKAIDAAEAAALAGDSTLEGKLNTAQEALEGKLAEVQKNLDDAKTELNQAIANGEKTLSGKITDLNDALESAKAAINASDSETKTELVSKIDEADAVLQAAIDALSSELDNVKNELQNKDDELQTFTIVVCVISSVGLCGSGAFVTWFFIDRKKRLF